MSKWRILFFDHVILAYTLFAPTVQGILASLLRYSFNNCFTCFNLIYSKAR